MTARTLIVLVALFIGCSTADMLPDCPVANDVMHTWRCKIRHQRIGCLCAYVDSIGYYCAVSLDDAATKARAIYLSAVYIECHVVPGLRPMEQGGGGGGSGGATSWPLPDPVPPDDGVCSCGG